MIDSPLLSSSALDLSVSELSDRYQSVLSSLLEARALLQRKTISARPSVPWYNNEIASQKKLRRKLERRWQRTKLDIDQQAYTNQCVRVQDLIINSKMKFYSKLISEAGDDQKSLFSSVSRLLHQKLEVLYPVCSSDSILVNNFADYFEIKIHNIRRELETIKPLPVDYSSIDMASRSNCELKEFTIAMTKDVCHTSIVNKCS